MRQASSSRNLFIYDYYYDEAKEESVLSSKPELAYYQDFEQKKPLGTIDFGEADVEEEKTIEFYVINFGSKDLRNVAFTSRSKDVSIVEYPVELPVGIRGHVKLKWKPSNASDLTDVLIIKGTYYRK